MAKHPTNGSAGQRVPRPTDVQTHDNATNATKATKANASSPFKPKSYVADSTSHDTGDADEPEPRTLLMPFIIVSFMILPGLAVLASVHNTASFRIISTLGYIQFLLHILWVAVPFLALCAAVYVIKAKSLIGKTLVLLMLALILVCTIVVLQPA